MNVAGTLQATPASQATREKVEGLIKGDALSVVFHPVMRLEMGTMLGTEALARMGDETSPREWFARAAEVGMQTDLEVLALRKALTWLGEIPTDAYMFVNATPHALVSHEFNALIPDGMIAERLIIDLSVDASVPSYSKLVEAVRELRALGARISIDDAGDDRGSWARINRLEPEVIKLGPAITRSLASDPKARSVARHFLAFAADIHADVIAEAIETEVERDMLIDLGVKFGQGFLFGRPAPLERTA